MVFRENITYMSNTLYYIKIKLYRGLPQWSSVKNLPYNAGNEVQSLVGQLRSLVPRGNRCARAPQLERSPWAARKMIPHVTMRPGAPKHKTNEWKHALVAEWRRGSDFTFYALGTFAFTLQATCSTLLIELTTSKNLKKFASIIQNLG